MTQEPRSRPVVDQYLAAVRHELADVPWKQREDLLATVRERLGELPADAVPTLELGPSRDYAQDLRESAGLPSQRRTPYARFRATRRRTKVASAGAVVLIAIVVAALIAYPHYQPITADAFFGAGNAQPITDNLVTDTDFVKYQPGKIIVTGIQIDNKGWAAATIYGVSIAGSPGGPLQLRELRATDDEQLTGTYQRIPIVKHVTVQPGKTVYFYIVLKMVTFPMGPPGGGETVDQPALLIHVLGVHHTVNVAGRKIGLLVR